MSCNCWPAPIDAWFTAREKGETAPDIREGRRMRWIATALAPELAALPAEQAQRLHAADVREATFYLYHHFNDNCTTRVRDLVDRATGAGAGACRQGRHANSPTTSTATTAATMIQTRFDRMSLLPDGWVLRTRIAKSPFALGG